MRALGVLLLLTGAAALQAAIPADTAPAAAAAAAAAVSEADARVAAAAHAAAAAEAAAAAAPPVTAATCHVNIVGNSQGSISRASMECSGGPVRIGAHPKMLGAFKQSFQGVEWDSECALSLCLIRFCGNTSVSISNSTFTGVSTVSVPEMLTVVCLADSQRMVLRHTRISNNNATAVVTARQSWLHVLNSTISVNNGYAQPGGIFSLHNSTVIVSSRSAIAGNTALTASGGGVAVRDNGTVVIAGGSVVKGNTAVNASGGGVFAVGNGTFFVLDGSVISGNTAFGFAGGGATIAENGTGIVTGHSVISGNTAVNASGGGVAVLGNGTLVLSGASRVVNNTCTDMSAEPRHSGGGVVFEGSSWGHIGGGSLVCNNTGSNGGGGIYVGGQAELELVGGTVVCNNTALHNAGGLLAAYDATVTIRNTTFEGNIAYLSGGGFSAMGKSRIFVFESMIRNNTSSGRAELRGSGGGVAAEGTGMILLSNGTMLLGNKAVGGTGGGFLIWENASLVVASGVSLVDNAILANLSLSAVQYGADGDASDASKLTIEPEVLGQAGVLTKCSRSIVLRRRPCGVGEFDGGAAGPCLCCPPFTFSFQVNAMSCQQCPPNAMCNADVVSPVVGFWHSSPRSLQMHKCPISASCQQGGECSVGYMGNLCGECSKGYGTTSPLRCGRCMAVGVHLGIYMLLVGATVSFITITVHFTWQDNKAGDKSLRPSDLIKVLVVFLQYMVILGSISVPWPAFLLGMFTAATMVFGVGSGQALSLDCWLPHYLPSNLPLALQRQLSYFIGAVCVALACAVLMNLLHICNRVWAACWFKPSRGSRQQQAPQLHFWSRLRVTLLVSAFYAYPTLVRGALSFFACLRIDDASKQPFPEYSIKNHTAGYWVSAIQQECFAGWHRAWALGFGVPTMLLLCAGVPVGLFVCLWRSKARTSDATFREHYGFLFRNYTESKPWWEAVWAVQTVLLTAISVFHFSIQAYYALLLMSLVLLLSVAAQIAARPYAQPLLHKLHLASTCSLFLIVWLSLALFSASQMVVVDGATLSRAHTAVGAIMVAIASSFIMWCVVIILRVASPALRASASSVSAWVQECIGGVSTRPHPNAQQQQSGSPIDQA